MKGDTWLDLVRFHFPEATEREQEDLLWNCTAYPVASASHIDEQLLLLRSKANSVGNAMRISIGEMDLSWKEAKQEEEA